MAGDQPFSAAGDDAGQHQDAPRETLGDRMARAAVEKIELENRILARQLSREGVLLQRLQAGGLIGAIFAVGATLFTGQQQLNVAQQSSAAQNAQAAEARLADRFDKSIGRLADKDSASIRIAGVTGLRLFLAQAAPSGQKEALRYLVTAVAGERSPDVLQAIVGAFANAASLDQGARDEALETAIEMDRNVTRGDGDLYARTMGAREIAILKSFLPGTDEAFIADQRSRLLAQLDFPRRMKAVSAYKTKLFGSPGNPLLDAGSDEGPALPTYVKIIDALVAAGARNASRNWAGIYCQGCNFTRASAGSLRDSRFDRSFLEGANFAHADLSHSTFSDADLAQTMFFAADLTGARLDWSAERSTFPAPETNQTRNISTRSFPYLECAILAGADLSGMPIMTIKREMRRGGGDAAGTVEQHIEIPALRYAVIDGKTTLSRVGVNVKVVVDGAYFDGLPENDRDRLEKAFFTPLFDWPDQIADAQFAGNFYMRQDVDFGTPADRLEIDDLRSNQTAQIDDVAAVGKSVKSLFRILADEPLFAQTPVTAALIRLSQGNAASTRPAQTPNQERDRYCRQPGAPDKDTLQIWAP